MALERRVLADPLNELVFRIGKSCDLYLVGGNLRDVILDRRSTDRDFVVAGDPRRMAETVASHAGGKAIILGGGRLFRIVLPDSSTIDFSKLGGDIDADLKQRDFTINSLGWSKKEGFIDPNNGLHDLRRRVVRMTSRDNLRSDPARIIRAYRFSAELDFGIEPVTRSALEELSSLVAAEKPERITLEFFRIMNAKGPWHTMQIMLEDGVLQHVILHSYEQLSSHVKAVSSLDTILDTLPLDFKFKLNSHLSQNLTYAGLLRLESLLRANPAVRLRASSAIMKRLVRLEKGEAFRRRKEKEGSAFWDILFDLFELLDSAAEDYLIINGMADLLPLCNKYRQIGRKGLLSTEEICLLTGLHEGESMGKVIRALKKAQFYNKIKDKDEACGFLKLIQVEP